MNASFLPWRELAWWVAPVAALVVVLGVEVDWGRRSAAVSVAAAAPAAKPVDPALLPEYTIPGGVDARSETINRTLFNPTRRPAPVPVQEMPKAQMQKGQFALTGTTVSEGKSTAFLREVKTGKFHRVREGDTINGLRVTEVKPDRVRLAAQGDSEDLVLKVAVNSKPTPVPPTAVAAAPSEAPLAGQPMPPQAAIPGQPVTAQTPEQAAQSLLERRRAARAAAAAANAAGVNATGAPVDPAAAAGAAPPIAAQPGAVPGQAGPGQTNWNDVFRAYQQRGVR